jgi:hypothetical protein
MSLDSSTFNYLSPTPEQVHHMQLTRDAAACYAEVLERLLPEGPDKTYCLRKLREVAMWANIALTRMPDGSARRNGGS